MLVKTDNKTVALETKDLGDGGGQEAVTVTAGSVAEVTSKIDELGRTWKQMQEDNDKRFAEIEKKGHADPLLEKKVDKIAEDLVTLAEQKERLEKIETMMSRPSFQGNEGGQKEGDDLHRKAMIHYWRTGDLHEMKALSVGGDPQGGYTVTPEMSGQIIRKVFETSPMRQYATGESISTDALEIPIDNNEAGAEWAGETAAPSETGTPDIGLLTIPVHKISAKPKATQEILEDSNIDIESWLSMKVADKIRRLENTAFVTGDGVAKPRGILDYPAGTTLGTQIEQINSGDANLLTADGLRSLFYALKGEYELNARWAMKRSTVEAVSKLKDSQNQYLWSPGLEAGEPQGLLGRPIVRMEDMPAVAANALAIAFADFRMAYTVVDRVGIRVLRDPYSSKPFIEFYTTKRTGGKVTNTEAIKIQKIAA